jgi:anti-sigma regulatory factor (Ser/Thr protein kinase)
VGRVRPHALLTVPLTVRGTLLGLLSLYRRAELPAFIGDDADLAAAVADYVSLCLENSRRYTREHAIAATVQRRLLPQAAQSAVALEIARGHLAAPQASGGWYDVVPLSSARTALVIGEVEGYGVYTSATMGQLRTALRSLATLDLEPDDLLARLDEAARHLAAERRALPPADPLREQALTASCVVAVYDPVSGSVTAARAGGPGLVLISPDGTLLDLDLPDGPLLGTSDTAPFAAVTVPQVPSGTIVALTSPALSDSLGEQGLRNILVGGTTSLREKCDRILLATAAGRRPGTAITLLGRTVGLAPDATVDWLLDVDEHAPGRARRHVRAQLQRWGLPDETAYTTELLVSELVTNVLRYGESPCRLSLIRADHLTIEVSDGGASSPHVRHARTTDEGGRGLYIVAQMADRWGVRSTTLGKTVWAEQSLGGRPAPADVPPGSPS